MGDDVGAGLLAPMPTWWGDTADETSQILTAFSTVATATPATEHTYVVTPTPEYALRTEDGRPVDTSTGPPPPNDPPFHYDGHLHRGSKWDAYWLLDGSLATDTSADHARGHFDAAFSTHAVVWGHDVTVARMTVLADSDTGEITVGGENDPSSNAELGVYLFGVQVAGGDESLSWSDGQDYNLPDINIWVFKIVIGVTTSASLNAGGLVDPSGFGLKVTPEASFGAHLAGEIGIEGIIDGGVDARIALLDVKLPVHATGKWAIDTNPAPCNRAFTYDAGADVTVASGGGEIDLVATFGPCPFCKEFSHRIFGWAPLSSKSWNVFTFPSTTVNFPLPKSVCLVPLDVVISAPATATAGVGAPVAVQVTRPATAGQEVPFIVDCNDVTWSSDDGAATFLFPVDRCHPIVTFATHGSHNITASARDAYGETGASSVTVNVVNAPTTVTAYITSPPDGTYVTDDSETTVAFTGNCVGGAAPITPIWLLTYVTGQGTRQIISGDLAGSFTIPAGQSGAYLLELMCVDGAGGVNTSSATIHAYKLN
jgi:hypothetical protein